VGWYIVAKNDRTIQPDCEQLDRAFGREEEGPVSRISRASPSAVFRMPDEEQASGEVDVV